MLSAVPNATVHQSTITSVPITLTLLL